MKRELHLLDGTIITNNDEIDSVVEIFRETLDEDSIQLALSSLALHPDLLGIQKPPLLGTLKIIEPAYEVDGEFFTKPIDKRADVELWFGAEPSGEGIYANLRPAWREYWFSIDIGKDEPLTVSAQIPLGIDDDNLPAVGSRLRGDKISTKKRRELEEKQVELFAKLKKEVVARLEALS